MTSIESILLQTLIVVLIPLWAEPVVLSAAPSGIAAREDQTLRTVPNVTTRCTPGELLVKWKEGPDSPAATLEHMSNIAVIYHSIYGHTKLQAEAVHRGAQSVSSASASAKLYTVEEATARLDELDAADAIIFGCPTYMGNMSAGMKAFLETAAKKWFTLAWKDKVAGAFTNSSSFSGDKLNTLVGLVINAMQHGMIFVSLGMMPTANRPGEMNTENGPGPEAHNRVGSFIGPMAASFQVNPPAAPPRGDIETAEAYGQRVAEITNQLIKGRNA